MYFLLSVCCYPMFETFLSKTIRETYNVISITNIILKYKKNVFFKTRLLLFLIIKSLFGSLFFESSQVN